MMQPGIWLCVLLAACALAEEGADSQNRSSSKRPYIADAVGNTIPPPPEGPAPVGSPSNLLTPDRYEFYTFDESGELVKRLMTLEEIQAIVAAGEGNDGHLVTLSNDDQPTIAFNFSQPPFTKVHSVVTNVQNVLKAQMEAQKNKPPGPTSLDTPDVSDSWSLILPSIFGNTGVDIVPDKMSNTFTTPETETIDIERPTLQPVEPNYLGKEGSNQILNTITPSTPELKTSPVTERATKETTTTTTTTTSKKPIVTSTTRKVAQSSTTISPRITTKNIPRTTTVAPRTTTVALRATTLFPKTTTVSSRTTTIRIKPTTKKSTPVIDNYVTIPYQKTNNNSITNKHTTKLNTPFTTEKTSSINFEKISTITTPSFNQSPVKVVTNKPTSLFKPSSTTTITNKYSIATTAVTTPAPKKVTTSFQPPVTTYKPVQIANFTPSIATDAEKDDNITTLTTQSVSPSTTVFTTQFMNVESGDTIQQTTHVHNINRPSTEGTSKLPDIPIFDIAQSINQITSDLENNFQNPTTSNLLDTTKISPLEIESKENVDIDIPNDSKNETTTETIITTKVGDDNDLFVKVSTIDPSTKFDTTKTSELFQEILSTSTVPTVNEKLVATTIDAILSESMDDLLSQIVNQGPHTIISTTVDNNLETVTTTTSTIKPVDMIKIEQTTTSQEPKITVQNIPNIQKEVNNLNNDTTLEKNTDSFSSNPIVLNRNDGNRLNTSIPDAINQNYVEISQVVTEVSVDEHNKIILNNVTVKQDTDDNITLNTRNNFEAPQVNDTKKSNKIVANVINNSILTNSVPKYQETLESTTSKQAIKNNTPLKIEENKFKDIKKIINSDVKVSINHKINLLSDSIQKEDIKKKIQKVNIDDKEFVSNIRNNSWKLISTVSPPKSNELPKDKVKTDHYMNVNEHHKEIVLEGSKENQGLEVTTKDLAEDIIQFTELCNEIAFRYWNTIVENVDKKRSFVLSPYSITSMLAMMFMGARGATSGEMNEILKLDDMVTFNPHFTLKNISDSIVTSSESGVAVSAFIRELYSDKDKGKILTFYKERAQHFYNGHVEEINFKVINDIIRRRTNLLVKRYTWGKIGEYMKSNSISGQPPLVAFSANIFETDCSGSSVEGRDGEMYFVVSPNVRQRRLVPVPAVVYKNGFLAGYDPILDATAAALGTSNSIVSTLFLMPGQQGNVVHAEDLDVLERRFLDTIPTTPTWNRLLRTLLPRNGLEIQIPRFLHKSTFNISSTLRNMGLKDLFDRNSADLGGINGPSKEPLYLTDMVQTTTFATCGEGVIGEQHHIEEYPETPEFTRRRRTSRWATGWDEPRDYQRAFHDPHDVGEAMHLPLHLRPRQARLPARSAQPARLKFDRPFLYFVRHNPSGMILYVGRYNPRLLP